ncbi:phosphotransferase [Actinomadura sp. 9N407]|uniref:phosphotransferase n=1 Tax=Actinomadura sp. 9N407 TaxID=3375154 RepID=UPI0037A9F3C1
MDASAPEWAPEHEVGAELAARLVGERWPEFRGVPVEPLAAGWDNTVFVVGGAWVFRFPRRSIAVPLLEREIAVLPFLAPRLPPAIPVPRYVARDPSPDYPWPFWGARMIPGRELADAGLGEDRRVRAAGDAGRFLRALHDPALVPQVELPYDPFRRADPSSRGPRARTRLAELARQGLWESDPAVEALLDAAPDAPVPDGAVVCHGDLHPRHLMIGEGGAVAGVIDWGDLCLGDPAVDLSLAYGAFAGTARAALLEAYGRPVGAAQETAARVLALFVCSALAEYAASEGNGALLAEALAGIGRSAAP